MHCYDIIFCIAGISLTFTFDDLSYNKVATQSHTYPASSTGAYNAVDRNTATCMKTSDIGTNSPYKTMWWKVDLGGLCSIYSIDIVFKNYDGYDQRQRGRYAGFSLYISNDGVLQGSTLCYKNGPQLPPLNFTTTCINRGRFVFFYNERLDGVSYPEGYEIANVFTEFCEVTVLGCRTAGVYGSHCNTSCPSNCKDDTCHVQNGTCFACKPGWINSHCNSKCGDEWYGVNCRQQCTGHCRDRTTCNHVTGQCDRGCAAGWTGSMCEKECDNRTYGYNCIKNCSGNCLNYSPCNKQTGHCDGGCNAGYTNGDCSKECLSGHFGVDCSKSCSGHCMNNEPCDHITGVCPRGCQDGYNGTFCNAYSLTPKQSSPSSLIWIVGFSISLGVNIIFTFGTFILCRGIVNKKISISGNLLSFRKESVYYADAGVKSFETSTYEELSVPAFITEPSYKKYRDVMP